MAYALPSLTPQLDTIRLAAGELERSSQSVQAAFVTYLRATGADANDLAHRAYQEAIQQLVCDASIYVPMLQRGLARIDMVEREAA